MKRLFKRTMTLLLCAALLPIENIYVFAETKKNEPPAYMRELSQLVAATASEDDFGEIQLTIGEAEMTVDGETQQITDDETVVPFVDGNRELQIPTEVIEEADAVGGYISEDALEEQGYAVTFNAETGKVRITEPYGLCRLIVHTANGKVRNTYGATQTLTVSDNRTILQFADKETTAAAAEQLRADPHVLACTADRIVSIGTVRQESSTNNSFIIPSNEPHCWGTQRSGADAWMTAHKDDDLAEVVVALIDTGVDATHPFLEGRVLSGGWDFYNDDADPMDDHNHGTHCAGIIRDATPDNVKILPIKLLSYEGKGDMAVAHEAMRWAVDQGADILSMSFGAYLEDGEMENEEEIEELIQEEYEPIQYAYDAGVICVAAAGNETNNLDEVVHMPGGAPHVITVSSIDEEDMPSYFSNYGSAVNVCAPGENIASSVPGGGYQYMSGTSMACPLTAAVCANFLSLDKTQTPDDLLDCLTLHAEDIGLSGRDDYCGVGCVSMRDHTPVSGITLPHETLRLSVATKVSLYHVLYSPAEASTRTATFTSSDPTVATVDGYGIVFTKKKGDTVITAVSTDGGFTASCAIHVFGGSGISMIRATDGNVFIRRTDGTVQYSGTCMEELGNKASPFESWETMRDPERMPISGVTSFWMLPRIYYKKLPSGYSSINQNPMDPYIFYTKEDGILRQAKIGDVSVEQKKEDGQWLTNITDMQRANKDVFALSESGEVYTLCSNAIWKYVRKADGSVLQNVRRIGKNAAFCEDGSVWLMTDPTGSRYMGNCTLAEPYTLVPDAVDGFILRCGDGINEPIAVLLRADGTVWGVGDNSFNFFGMPDIAYAETPVQITFADGQPLSGICALHFTGFSVYALQEDGTVFVWGTSNTRTGFGEYDYLGTGESTAEPAYPKPVVTEDGSPLTGVRALLPADSCRMLFLREDDSVWICGLIKYKVFGVYVEGIYSNYAKPYTIEDDPVSLVDIPMEPFEFIVPAQSVSVNAEQIFIGVGDTFQLDARILPENADNQTVSFTVLDKSMSAASVSSTGVVTGVSVGTTTIRAYSVEAQTDVYTDCTVTVSSAGVESVYVSKLPDKTVLDQGEPLDTTGGELCIRLADGTFEFIPLRVQLCQGYDPQCEGWQCVTVDYCGRIASFSVFVRRNKNPVSITLTEPEKTEYLLGEELDLTGGAVTICFSDGSQLTIPLTEEMCSPFNNETESAQTITVSYLEKSASFVVHVHAPRICGIRNYSLPNKLNYYAGETQVRTTGGAVQYVYEDGTLGDVVRITPEMCDNLSLKRLGEHTVTVTLDGFTTSFTVYVHKIAGATLSMLTYPEALYYKFSYKTTLNPYGGSVLLRYPDGATETAEIEKDMCTLPKDHTPTLESWEITVTYKELTTTFTIYNCVKTSVYSTLKRIEMVRLPDKRQFLPDEELLPDGGIVRMYGADGETIDVALSSAMYTYEFEETDEPINHKIWVAIQGRVTSFTVTVLPSSSASPPDDFCCWVVKPPDKTVFVQGEGYSYPDIGKGGIYAYKSKDKVENEIIVEVDMTSNELLRYTGIDTTRVGEQTVTVFENDTPMFAFTIYVTDAALQFDAPLLQRGQWTQARPVFRYTPQEEKRITWSSSDTTVATVNDQGRVTSVGVGTAEITAKFDKTTCSAVQTITVQEDPVEPTGIVFLQTPEEPLIPGEVMQMLVSILPINAAGSIVWTSSDPSILSVDETGVVTANRPGEVEITAQIKDSDAAVTCTVTVVPRAAERNSGDADGDGELTLKDVIQIERYLAGGWNAFIDLQNADVDGDNAVTLKDIVLLRRHLAGGWGIDLN